MLYAAALCAAASLALALKWQHGATVARPPYPPGPKGYPFVGSVLELPRDMPTWKGFTLIAEKFSRYSASVGGHQTKDAKTRMYCT